MHEPLSTTHAYFLAWRLARTDYYAPLVVVQIVAGILLGPAFAGRAFPEMIVITSVLLDAGNISPGGNRARP